MNPSVFVFCFFSRAWFFCCSKTSRYWRAASFSTPLEDFFLRLLFLFSVVLGLSSAPSGDSRVIGGLDSSGLIMGCFQRVSSSRRASRAATSSEWPPSATDWVFPSGLLAATWELCSGRGLMGFFQLGPLVAVPPLAATLAYDTGVSVRRERGRFCPVSRPAIVHCGGCRLCRGRSLGFELVASPLHGDVERNVGPAPQ